MSKTDRAIGPPNRALGPLERWRLAPGRCVRHAVLCSPWRARGALSNHPVEGALRFLETVSIRATLAATMVLRAILSGSTILALLATGAGVAFADGKRDLVDGIGVLRQPRHRAGAHASHLQAPRQISWRPSVPKALIYLGVLESELGRGAADAAWATLELEPAISAPPGTSPRLLRHLRRRRRPGSPGRSLPPMPRGSSASSPGTADLPRLPSKVSHIRDAVVATSAQASADDSNMALDWRRRRSRRRPSSSVAVIFASRGGGACDGGAADASRSGLLRFFCAGAGLWWIERPLGEGSTSAFASRS